MMSADIILEEHEERLFLAMREARAFLTLTAAGYLPILLSGKVHIFQQYAGAVAEEIAVSYLDDAAKSSARNIPHPPPKHAFYFTSQQSPSRRRMIARLQQEARDNQLSNDQESEAGRGQCTPINQMITHNSDKDDDAPCWSDLTLDGNYFLTSPSGYHPLAVRSVANQEEEIEQAFVAALKTTPRYLTAVQMCCPRKMVGESTRRKLGGIQLLMQWEDLRQRLMVEEDLERNFLQRCAFGEHFYLTVVEQETPSPAEAAARERRRARRRELHDPRWVSPLDRGRLPQCVRGPDISFTPQPTHLPSLSSAPASGVFSQFRRKKVKPKTDHRRQRLAADAQLPGEPK